MDQEDQRGNIGPPLPDLGATLVLSGTRNTTFSRQRLWAPRGKRDHLASWPQYILSAKPLLPVVIGSEKVEKGQKSPQEIHSL